MWRDVALYTVFHIPCTLSSHIAMKSFLAVGKSAQLSVHHSLTWFSQSPLCWRALQDTWTFQSHPEDLMKHYPPAHMITSPRSIKTTVLPVTAVMFRLTVRSRRKEETAITTKRTRTKALYTICNHAALM